MKLGANNFDLIRLAAALQVALTHADEVLGTHVGWIQALKFFPGVPVFFFISGMLIYRSWLNVEPPRARVFFTNRVLRLYPALFFCFAFSVALVAFTGYFGTHEVGLGPFLVWMAAQLSIGQFYNPAFLRDYGVGVLNGSLWTISVEVQFYLLTPLVWWLYTRKRALAIALAVAFVLANAAYTHLPTPHFGREALVAPDGLALKLAQVSFVPWIYMFMAGAWVASNDRVARLVLRIPLVVLLLVYVPLYALSDWALLGTGNGINLAAFAVLAAIVLKLAHTAPGLSERLLGRNDISYGIYIYHMPVVNFLVFHGVVGSVPGLSVAITATTLVALVSWHLVERPALGLKRVALVRR